MLCIIKLLFIANTIIVHGSYLHLASIVECQSIPLSNTLNQCSWLTLNQPLIDPLLTLDGCLINTPLTPVDTWLMNTYHLVNTCPTIDTCLIKWLMWVDVDRVLTEFQPGSYFSVYQDVDWVLIVRQSRVLIDTQSWMLLAYMIWVTPWFFGRSLKSIKPFSLRNGSNKKWKSSV